MSRRRRAALLLGLALVLAVLAASEVSRREREIASAVGPVVPVVVVDRDVRAGERLTAADVAVRSVPRRFAPAARVADPRRVLGRRARVELAGGTDVVDAAFDGGGSGPALRDGERIFQLVAVGDAERIRPGVRVDLLVTNTDATSSAGSTRLALEDAEVLAAEKAPPAEGADSQASRVSLELRVTVRQSVALTAAQSGAAELRVLARGPGDDGRGDQGLTSDDAARAGR